MWCWSGEAGDTRGQAQSMSGSPFQTRADLWNGPGLESDDLNWKLKKGWSKSPNLRDKGPTWRKTLRTQRQKQSPRGVVHQHGGPAAAQPWRNWPIWAWPDAQRLQVWHLSRELLLENREINTDFYGCMELGATKLKMCGTSNTPLVHPLETCVRLGSGKEQPRDAQGCLWG